MFQVTTCRSVMYEDSRLHVIYNSSFLVTFCNRGIHQIVSFLVLRHLCHLPLQYTVLTWYYTQLAGDKVQGKLFLIVQVLKKPFVRRPVRQNFTWALHSPSISLLHKEPCNTKALFLSSPQLLTPMIIFSSGLKYCIDACWKACWNGDLGTILTAY